MRYYQLIENHNLIGVVDECFKPLVIKEALEAHFCYKVSSLEIDRENFKVNFILDGKEENVNLVETWLYV